MNTSSRQNASTDAGALRLGYTLSVLAFTTALVIATNGSTSDISIGLLGLALAPLALCLYTSFRFPRGMENNRHLIWPGGLSLGFVALMLIDYYDEIKSDYHINSFGNATNGFLLDGIGVVFYGILIPLFAALGVLLLIINSVKKAKRQRNGHNY